VHSSFFIVNAALFEYIQDRPFFYRNLRAHIPNGSPLQVSKLLAGYRLSLSSQQLRWALTSLLIVRGQCFSEIASHGSPFVAARHKKLRQS